MIEEMRNRIVELETFISSIELSLQLFGRSASLFRLLVISCVRTLQQIVILAIVRLPYYTANLAKVTPVKLDCMIDIQKRLPSQSSIICVFVANVMQTGRQTQICQITLLNSYHTVKFDGGGDFCQICGIVRYWEGSSYDVRIEEGARQNHP